MAKYVKIICLLLKKLGESHESFQPPKREGEKKKQGAHGGKWKSIRSKVPQIVLQIFASIIMIYDHGKTIDVTI